MTVCPLAFRWSAHTSAIAARCWHSRSSSKLSSADIASRFYRSQRSKNIGCRSACHPFHHGIGHRDDARSYTRNPGGSPPTVVGCSKTAEAASSIRFFGSPIMSTCRDPASAYMNSLRLGPTQAPCDVGCSGHYGYRRCTVTERINSRSQRY